jgi:transposase InsO family protein
VPGKAWVTDITYIRTYEGFAYLAVVLDLFSRASSDGRSRLGRRPM